MKSERKTTNSTTTASKQLFIMFVSRQSPPFCILILSRRMRAKMDNSTPPHSQLYKDSNPVRPCLSEKQTSATQFLIFIT